MIRGLFLAAACLIWGASAAEAGPLVAAVSAVAGWFAGLSPFALAAVRIVSGLALNAIGAAIQKRNARRAAANQRDPGLRTSVTLTGGLNPDGMITGDYATGGYLVAPPLEHGANNIYNSAVIDLSGVPLTGLNRVFVNGSPIDLGADDAIIEGENFGKPALGRYADHLWIKFYDGSQTAADPMLLARGQAVVPPDLSVWTSRVSGTAGNILAVAYGNGLWVAVGLGLILTSPDGVTWTQRTSGVASQLAGVTYANGLWKAVGNQNGVILKSSDGITWTQIAANSSGWHWDILYANGKWVTAREVGVTIYDEETETWPTTVINANFSFLGVAYGNGQWVVAGTTGGGGGIYSSPDLVTWTLRSSSSALIKVRFGNGQFVTVGLSGTVLTSPDGITWTAQTLGSNANLFGLGYGNGEWVATGDNGRFFTSPDGVTWTNRPSGVNNDLWSAAYAQGQWTVVGWGGRILTAGTFVPPTAKVPPYPWSSDMVGIGRGYAIATYKFNREVWQGQPNFRFEPAGVRFYDKRLDTTQGGDGAHRLDDPATWEFTRNPMVKAAHLFMGYLLPDGTTYAGGYTQAQVPLADWAAAMNACDAMLAGLDGTQEPAWRAAMEISFEDEPLDAINALLQACDAEIVDRGGIIYPKVGAPGLPVAFITDDDLIVSQPATLEPFPGLQETVNGVALSHPSPAAGWETVEAPRVLRPDLEAADGDRRLIQALTIPACPYPGQIQRLGEAMVRDARRWRRHIVTLPRDLAHVRPLQTIAWTSAENGYTAKLFEVAEQAVDLFSYDAQVTLREVDPADYALQPYQAVNAQSVVLPAPAPITLSGAGAEALTLSDANGDPRRPAIRAFWTGFSGAGVEVEVTRAGAVVAQITAPASAGVAVISAEIIAAEVYAVRLRPVPAGVPVAWSGPFSVTAPSVTIAPADLGQDVIATPNIVAGSVTLSGVATAGAVTNNAATWTSVASLTLTGLQTAGFVNGHLDFRLTAGEADATDYPAAAEWRVTVAGTARRTITRAEMLDRGGAFFTGHFTAAAVGPGDVSVVFEIREMGGLGVEAATLFAQAALR